MGNSDYGTDVANQFDWDETKKLGAEPFSFDMNATYNPATHTWGSTHVDSGVGQGGGLPFTWGGGNSGTAIGAGAPGTTGTLGTTAGAVVPMTTPWWQSSTIPALINAAIAIKAMRDQGKKPNFYTAPQTPQDIWKEGKTRDLFDFYSKLYEQMIAGSGNLNPNWQMPNSDIGNPAFMGGVRVPTFDPSKLGSISNPAGATTTPTPSGGDGAPVKNMQSAQIVDWNAIKPYGSGAITFAQQMQEAGQDGPTIVATVKKIFGGGPPEKAPAAATNPFEAAMYG
jgi:hypothetical protein